MSTSNDYQLLEPTDCSPVAWVNPRANSPVALVCEHAGNSVPVSLHNLGLSAEKMQEHIAVDIGAEATARRIAEILNIPLLSQRYSRLLIDCNRPTSAPDSIPEISHGTHIPANKDLNELQRNARINEVFVPYDNALVDLLMNPGRMFAFSIHSFTPTLNKQERPWDIGFLYRNDTQTSAKLQRYINHHFSELSIGLNQPYQIDDESDWFVPRHAERLKLHHSLIEIRNDHIRTAAGQEHMASILAAAIRTIIS